MTDDWETVSLNGLPSLVLPGLNHQVSPPMPRDIAKGTELQSRIADLNHCNEVLLARVNQLEEALERSQQALQQEVERSQRLSAEDSMVAAQTRSVAQLLSELDTASEALKRQTLLADTLGAQLKTAEERSQRLEKECAILRKRKSERAKQLQVTEETCTDLRSRLQRQQQYTLQFKAALEKCLDTSAFQHTSDSIENGLRVSTEAAPTETAAPSIHTIGMPRSESIRPWSANPAQVSADPQLQSLIRPPIEPTPPVELTISAEPIVSSQPVTASQPAIDETESEPLASTAPSDLEPAAPDGQRVVSKEAEQQLWQDIERLMGKTAKAPSLEPEPTIEPIVTVVTDPAAPTDPPGEAVTAATEFTEPIPWGAPINPESSESSGDDSPLSDELTVAEQLPAAIAEPPYSSQVESRPLPHLPSDVLIVPALDAMKSPQNSPSPLVHPQRSSQRKRKSLSAVELPSFPPLPKVQNQ